MGILFNLLRSELESELAPRGSCKDYIYEKGGNAELITKEEFDDHYNQENFKKRPFEESFGDGPMDPYSPERQAYGQLNSGTVVYCELSKANREKTSQLIELLSLNEE